MISNPLTKNKAYCASEKEKVTSNFSESPTYQTTYCLPRQSTVCVCNLYQISSLVAEPGGSKRLKMKLVPSGNCHKPHGWQSLQCESRWLLLLTTVQLNSSPLKFITDIKNYNTSDRKTKERWPEILPWSWTQGGQKKRKGHMALISHLCFMSWSLWCFSNIELKLFTKRSLNIHRRDAVQKQEPFCCSDKWNITWMWWSVPRLTRPPPNTERELL